MLNKKKLFQRLYESRSVLTELPQLPVLSDPSPDGVWFEFDRKSQLTLTLLQPKTENNIATWLVYGLLTGGCDWRLSAGILDAADIGKPAAYWIQDAYSTAYIRDSWVCQAVISRLGNDGQMRAYSIKLSRVT